MGLDSAWARLLPLVREAHLLETASDLCGWDRDVNLPPRGIAQRAELSGLLAALVHERLTDQHFVDALADCRAHLDSADPDDLRAADVRELERALARRQRLTAALVAECARVETSAQQAWAAAREARDFAAFAPWLRRLLELARERAAAWGTPPGGEPWDALGEEFEPGVRAQEVRGLFATLVPRLRDLIAQVAGSSRVIDDRPRHVPVPIAKQEAFVREVASALGFDFERGRLDRSAHPFTSGTHPDDVRITTRYAESDLFDALYSTIHEVGHGLYEQGLPRERIALPTGRAVSLGIHESQSRLWENHVGRSAGFWEWAAPRLRALAGTTDPDHGAAALLRASHRVEPSLIRVDADEATYDLHIAIRFGIEVDLLAGTLAVVDLPARWNADYRALLGVEVPHDGVGCLQDVHWAAGLFGYFPTYTLGNLAAAQFAAKARAELGDLDPSFARGDFRPLLEWLRSRVHRHGGRHPAAELIQRATGRELSADAFLSHLAQRCAGIDDLD